MTDTGGGPEGGLDGLRGKTVGLLHAEMRRGRLDVDVVRGVDERAVEVALKSAA